MLKIISTGTGRCGTTYMAKLITSLGINCGHESIFDYSNDEIIKNRLNNKKLRTLSKVSQIKERNWVSPESIEAESSYMAAPHLDWPELDETKIIHIVRNPLEVIRSFVLDFKYFNKNMPDKKNPFNELGFEEKIWKYLPELENIENKFERASFYYCHWNKMIEDKIKNKKSILIKIEDENKIEKISEFIEKPINNNVFNKKTNSFEEITGRKNNQQVKLNDIPNGKVKNELLKMSDEYGYKLNKIL